MANQGKRMVKENLIAQIGQGTTYTAGTGIDITEDVISVDTTSIQEKLTAGDNITISEGVISAADTTYTAGEGIDITSNEISVDNNTVALKQDLEDLAPALEEFIYNANGQTLGIDGFFATIPFIKTNDFTDTLNADGQYVDPAGNAHDVITLDQNDLTTSVKLSGTFALRKTSSNTTYLVTTVKESIAKLLGTQSGTVSFNKLLAQRTGNNDLSFWYCRTAEEGDATIYDGEDYAFNVKIYRVTRHTYNQINTFRSSVNTGGMLGANIRIDNMKANVNVASTPTTSGTYTLQCIVDATGQVVAVEWSLVQ